MPSIDRETIVQTGVATSSTRDRSPARTWICRVVSGEDTGATVAVGPRPLRIGADGSCELVIRDLAVSRFHAEVQLVSEGLRVRDLDSTNGTYYQSSRVKEVIVPGDATIRLGETHLRISPVPPPCLPPSQRTCFGGLVGQGVQMREVFAVLELASPSEATVLIEGESGTGKELAARAIHDHSDRAAGPFVIVDCSATHDSLIDSLLYGHVRGAFTGAVSERRGSIVEAHGGTLFLDEIGELPLPSQAKLLRAIEDHTVQQVGSDRRLSVDVRVVAATHRDLQRMIAEGHFRFDLFQRLAVVHVRMPALRERPEDLLPLIRHFYAGRGVDPGLIEGDNLNRLQAYDWPGNVRELRNVLERAWVLSGPGRVPFGDLRIWLQASASPGAAGSIDTSQPFKVAKDSWICAFERRYVEVLFAECDGNISRAAARAGINRNHFRKLLDKYGLGKP